jgi:hypothetical protein
MTTCFPILPTSKRKLRNQNIFSGGRSVAVWCNRRASTCIILHWCNTTEECDQIIRNNITLLLLFFRFELLSSLSESREWSSDVAYRLLAALSFGHDPDILDPDAWFGRPQITHNILKLHNCTIIICRTQPARQELRVVGERGRRMGSNDNVVRDFLRNIKC